MQGVPFRIAPLALFALPLALGFGCSGGSDDETGLDSGATGGRSNGARGGRTGSGGSGNTSAGGSASGGAAASSSGGSSASGGTNGLPTAGTSSSAGSGSGVACEGLPYGTGEGGGAGDEACIGIGAEAEPVPVDLFIMMDRSDSMANEVEGTGQMRWDALREAMQAFVDAAEGDDIRAGIGFFGQSGGNDDALDCDADRYAEPTVEIAPIADVGGDLVDAMADMFPAGLTPTAPALTGALEYAAGSAEDNPERATFVVLVTDGYPTQCEPTAVSSVADIAESAYLAEASVRTYVVGVDAEFNLNNIAIAGGTNEAFLVDSENVADSFVTALRNVSNSRLACEYNIPPPPSGTQVIDLEEVQVTYTTAEERTEEVPRIQDLEACARNPNGGWYYDDLTNPKRIKVCPCTCARFQAGRVDVRLGCKPKIGLR
ncbi:MAG TPA: vWA domain-containing protein [Polyangiaceae bacterium]